MEQKPADELPVDHLQTETVRHGPQTGVVEFENEETRERLECDCTAASALQEAPQLLDCHITVASSLQEAAQLLDLDRHSTAASAIQEAPQLLDRHSTATSDIQVAAQLLECHSTQKPKESQPEQCSISNQSSKLRTSLTDRVTVSRTHMTLRKRKEPEQKIPARFKSSNSTAHRVKSRGISYTSDATSNRGAETAGELSFVMEERTIASSPRSRSLESDLRCGPHQHQHIHPNNAMNNYEENFDIALDQSTNLTDLFSPFSDVSYESLSKLDLENQEFTSF
jgi:hypothetical protein